MIPILDWIFEGIVGWVSSIASQLLDAVSGLFLEALGTDMTAMEEYFPFVTKAYGVMQVTAYAILILIVLWQLFRAFGGPITEAENPWHLVVRGAIFGFLIGYAKPIFSACLTIAREPYTSLMDLSMTGEDFTFAGVEQALTNGLTTLVATASVVGLILILILLIALGWNYFKLLLETVERYIVVGVLCYTSPLAFSMGASKSTNNVFKSWCRMVGSQLLLLVMNVWFLRGFASSMGHFIGNGGALTTGKGSIFLWMFCALAYLKCAQRFDSYLASMGLNVAQTGSSMGMELLMAARVISGVGSGARSAGSVFGRAGGGATATGTGAAATGFAAGFASRFSPNSYVRDAVVEGGTRMGFSGGAGFVGRAFGGIAARNGATLNDQSISSVASRAPGASGTIAGDIADRSLSNYMPHMQGFQMKGTQITGGRISTTATTPDGKKANVDMYSASQFEKPDAPHSVVTASDGSQWYQMASGEGRGAFYDAPVFGGMNAQASGGVNSDDVNPPPGESGAGTEVPGVQTDASGAPAGENIIPGAECAPQSIGEFPGDQTHIIPGASEGMQPEGIIPGGAEVPGVQTDASGAPVSEGIVPGSDAMPQGVATFLGDQMHEVPGTTEGIVPGGVHMPEAGGEDSIPGMVGQQLDGGQLGVMPSGDPNAIGEQIHPKSEMYNDTSQLFRNNGYEVKVFNLVDPTRSDTWNCMSDMGTDSLMAQMLTNIIIGNTNSGKSDHFWDNGELNLLKALVLYVALDSNRTEDQKNLAEVYLMITDKSDKDYADIYKDLPKDHPARSSLNLYIQASETVRQGIKQGLGTRLQVLQNKVVTRLISGNEIDLTAPGKRKCAYYIILSDQETSMAFLSSLFFSFMFIKLTRFADNSPGGHCPVPVNLVLDEFNNIGRIGGAPDGSDFARSLSVIRSRDIRVMIAVQSLGQLQNRYPNNLWAEIIGNCDIQLMLGCTDDVTANYFSARSGDLSIQVDSTMTTKQTVALAQVIPQYRETQGHGRRKLLTPDEVLRLPHNEMLVIIRGQNILKLTKFDYTRHPMSKEMIPVSIMDYQPVVVYNPVFTQPPGSQNEQPERTSKRRNIKKNDALRATASDMEKSSKPPTEF